MKIQRHIALITCSVVDIIQSLLVILSFGYWVWNFNFWVTAQFSKHRWFSN
jgi:hypothetical protein